MQQTKARISTTPKHNGWARISKFEGELYTTVSRHRRILANAIRKRKCTTVYPRDNIDESSANWGGPVGNTCAVE